MALIIENQDRFVHKIPARHSGLYFQVHLSPAAARDLGLLLASHINITEWCKTPSK